MKILKKDGRVLIDLPQFDNIKQAVEHCVKINIHLYEADLRGANLYMANLTGGSFWYANLAGANLQHANLQGAKLRGANLQGANLREAKTQYCARFGHFSKIGGRTCLYYKPVESEPFWLIQAGCFNGTLEQFEAACKAKYPNDPVQAYEAQIEYLKEILL
jgi:hypothetical protein